MASVALIAALTGCSSTDYAQSTGPAGSLAAQDAYAGAVMPRGVMSMAAGDQLGMAVYSQDYELARGNTAGTTRVARHANPNTTVQPTVASVDDQR